MSFLIVVIAGLSLMYGYVGWRIIIPADFGLLVTLLLWGLLVLLLILPFIPVILRFKGIEGGWIDIISWIAYFGFGFLTLLFAVLLSKDILYLLTLGGIKIVHVIRNISDASSGGSGIIDSARRHFLTNALNIGVLGVTGILTGYGLYEALRTPRIVKLDIPMTGLPKDLDGFTIVQITDIHVSSTIKRPFIEKVVGIVNSLKPDLVALTGDLVDGSVKQLGHDVAPLADLSAPAGMFFITGNHEYYSGVQQWIDETGRLGFTVLLNEHVVIERGQGKLLLAGVTDLSGGQFNPEHVSDPHKAMAGAPPCDAKILLAHQPKSIFEAEKAGFDYVISGHTHGGQYLPYHFLAALAQPYIAGMHQYGRSRIYVSRGTGYWGPQLRIGAPSEITVHRLIAA